MYLRMIVSCSLAYSAVKCYLFTFMAPVISADIPASGWIIPTGEREIMCPPSVSTAAHISLIQSLEGESRRWKHSVETDCVKWQVGGCWFELKYIYIFILVYIWKSFLCVITEGLCCHILSCPEQSALLRRLYVLWTWFGPFIGIDLVRHRSVLWHPLTSGTLPRITTLFVAIQFRAIRCETVN